MTKGFQVLNLYRAIENQLLEGIKEGDAGKISAALNRVSEDSRGIENQIESLGMLFKEAAGSSKEIQKEILPQLTEIASRKLFQENIRAFLLQLMEKQPLKVVGTIVEIQLYDSPPAVEIVEESLIPAAFWRIIPERKEVNREAIIEFFKQNKAALVPGAVVSQGHYIKVK